MKVSFIGLGVMGSHMAGHLVKNKFYVTGYNRSLEKGQAWQKKFTAAKVEKRADLAVKGAGLVFICINKDEDIRELITAENGILKFLEPGSVIVDHSTSSASLAIEMAEVCKAKQVDFLDAPVSGGEKGAQDGKLAVMVGGDQVALKKALPAINSFAKEVVHMGKSGAGQYAKMVNQICIAGVLQGLAEGLSFAEKANLDIEKLLQIISKGAAQSWQMENRGLTMSQDKFDFGFAVDLMRKDLNIALKAAEDLKAELPITAVVNQFYKKISKMGGARWDTSSLIKIL